MSRGSREGALILGYAVVEALFAEDRNPMKRKFVMAGATFFLAAATGHVMQNGDVIGAKLRGALNSSPPATEVATPVAEAEAAPTAAVLVASASAQTIAPAPAAATPAPAPAATTASAAAVQPAPAAAPPVATPAVAVAPAAVRPTGTLPDLPGLKVETLDSGTVLAARMDAVSDKYQRPKTDADEEYSVFGIPCGASRLDLGLGAGGTLKATLTAPCHPEERVVFSHAGLSFTLLTDAAGSVAVTIPAMATEAAVDAAFASGEVLSAERRVPDLDSLRRVALSGEGELHLNVFEDGASDPAATDAARFVTLGDASMDDPKIVEVYTVSAGAKAVAVETEAEATAASCGRTVKARVVSMAAGKIGVNDMLSQAMPGCDALGDMVQAPLPGWDGPLTVATSQ